MKLRTVEYDKSINAINLIDQRNLPFKLNYINCHDSEECAKLIKDMATRGAGAIGAMAAYGMAQAIVNEELVTGAYKTLLHARPTAVDLKNGIDYVLANQDDPVKAAENFVEGIVKDCEEIKRHGSELIGRREGILTHCNAGWLAFVEEGTGSATAPIYGAYDQGKEPFVFVDETRPRLQGSSLTAWELDRYGVNHAIITDNSAASYMAKGCVDKIITGTDRIVARTGHVFNKIGTYSLAVLANYHKIPFYVAAPVSTLDKKTTNYKIINIENRNEEEVKQITGQTLHMEEEIEVRIANKNSKAYNQAFDVTPPELITGYITPKGIVKADELLGIH
tara:strand:- start:101 stop:1108 length:1008 start_codon:yes stop_codon:yes gene_type:complete